jgi:hypothetical protein
VRLKNELAKNQGKVKLKLKFALAKNRKQKTENRKFILFYKLINYFTSTFFLRNLKNIFILTN